MLKSKQGYTTPKFQHEIDLKLNANESCSAISCLADFYSQLDETVSRHYPNQLPLQESIGRWLEVDHQRIVITAGGDESIARIIGLLVNQDRNQIVTHAPTFEMVKIYADHHDGELVNIDWLDGDFPLESVHQAINQKTAVVVLTTPNNPTGQSIDSDAVLALIQTAQAHGAVVLLDHAYIEFADAPPDVRFGDYSNVFVVRTFSKAWGLAGLRVGYTIAPNADTAAAVRNSSGPYPVSGTSLAAALQSVTSCLDAMQTNVSRIKTIRRLMQELLPVCGGSVIPSDANFVLVRFDRAEQLWSELAARGIGVRKFVDRPVLSNYLRITCPATEGDYLRLLTALCEISEIDPEPFRNQAAMSLKPNVVVEETPKPHPVAVEGRTHQLQRTTKETDIDLSLNLDGSGNVEVSTGIGFLDHMLTALAFHGGMDLKLICQGDLEVDDHHTAEDCALALGTAIDSALGPRKGIQRFGFAYAPLDEALARSVVDLSGRPWPEVHLQLEREMVGSWACENITHFFQSLAMTLKCSLHVDVLRGQNDHHRVEAAFKSFAKALKEAVTRTDGDVPSTKGVL